MNTRLTHTGPKRLHSLYKHVLSKLSAYSMNAPTQTKHIHFFTRTLLIRIKHNMHIFEVIPFTKLQNDT